jgi:Fe-S-cluster containining protein
MPQIETLGPLRHICHASGGCCQGNIAMLKESEQEKVIDQAQKLKITRPIQHNALRKDVGRCVFLADDQRCRIHARFGEPEKPSVCRQFPLVAIHTEQEIRIGIDPGCLSAWKTWKEGPLLSPGSLISTKNPIPSSTRKMEQNLLDMLGTEGTSITKILDQLTGSAQRFCTRWNIHLSKTPLNEVLSREGTAPIFRTHLSPLAKITKEASIDITLSTEQEEWVLETAQRMLYLRFLSKDLTPHATTLLCLGGAIACAWSNPQPTIFGPAFAAWNRAIRSTVFLATLLPTPNILPWLAGQTKNL